ncbi:MAG TPA: hypothetical protein VFN25_10210 [Dokdonella sp.]|uniref:hypothetical protein n=1 Tax=Dokdonella sp. TaxID=2291710 RepID=UPI002D80F946|nr:hypothetical protein [Dokdonella sp.]HET9033267.1 hypothetical protein [Dokdonella sp.]
MSNTRPEQTDQGKNLFSWQSLHLKPSWWLFVLLAICSMARAQDQRIHRCIGENGEPTFSDQKCSALKASPAPAMPAATPDQTGNQHDPLTRYAVPPTTQTCAISAEDLRNRVVAAFATANGVSLSGLFLWEGFGQVSAIAALRDLARLIGEPLISVDVESTLQFRERDRYRDRNDRYAGDELHELVIRTVGEQDRNVPYESVRRYDMREQSGCWWLLMQ